jgi:hypothetical protein
LRKYLIKDKKRISPWHDLAFKPEEYKEQVDIFTGFFEIGRYIILFDFMIL